MAAASLLRPPRRGREAACRAGPRTRPGSRTAPERVTSARARLVVRADLAEPRRAVAGDQRELSERLDVLHEGRPPVDPALERSWRRRRRSRRAAGQTALMRAVSSPATNASGTAAILISTRSDRPRSRSAVLEHGELARRGAARPRRLPGRRRRRARPPRLRRGRGAARTGEAPCLCRSEALPRRRSRARSSARGRRRPRGASVRSESRRRRGRAARSVRPRQAANSGRAVRGADRADEDARAMSIGRPSEWSPSRRRGTETLMRPLRSGRTCRVPATEPEEGLIRRSRSSRRCFPPRRRRPR